MTYIAGLTRNKYFAGKVLTEQDFTAEQNYVREKVRLHNLNLHGWGIASGLKVSTTADWKGIMVSPGMALDRYGRELVVHRPVVIQLLPEPSPWWLTLTYTERETNPMPTPTPSDTMRIAWRILALKRASRCPMSQTIPVRVTRPAHPEKTIQSPLRSSNGSEADGRSPHVVPARASGKHLPPLGYTFIPRHISRPPSSDSHGRSLRHRACSTLELVAVFTTCT